MLSTTLGKKFSVMRILCMHSEWLIPLVSTINHPIVVLLSLSNRSGLSFSAFLTEFEIITGSVEDSLNKHIKDDVVVA